MLYLKNYHSDNGIKLFDGSFVPLATSLKTAFIDKAEELFRQKV